MINALSQCVDGFENPLDDDNHQSAQHHHDANVLESLDDTSLQNDLSNDDDSHLHQALNDINGQS